MGLSPERGTRDQLIALTVVKQKYAHFRLNQHCDATHQAL
jgi:hypothetical protein